MKRAVFEIKQNSVGNYYFIFKDPDRRTHAISCNFPDRAELEICLARVRDAAVVADVWESSRSAGAPPFFRIQPGADGVMFSLIGFQEEIIFSSVPYADKTLCREAISNLKAFSQRAGVVDLTVE